MYKSFLGVFSVTFSIFFLPLDIEDSGILKCSVLPKWFSEGKKKVEIASYILGNWKKDIIKN